MGIGTVIVEMKRGHWCLVGVIVGLFLSYLHRAPDPVNVRSILQPAFEAAIHHPLVQGNPPVVRLVVNAPHDGWQFVTGEELLPVHVKGDAPKYLPFSFRAAFPYRVTAGTSSNSSHSVRDLLDAPTVHAVIGGYTYAWWTAPALCYLFWTGSSLLLIGGVWPTILNILVAAGYGPKVPEAPYDLNRFTSEADPAKPAADAAGLDDAITEALENAGASAGSEAAVASVDAIRALNGSDDVSALPIETEEKTFGGQFYPTRAHAPPEEH